MTRLADQCLYVLNTNAPFTHDEQLVLILAKEQNPDLQIDFMLQVDEMTNDREKVFEETRKRILIYFPDATLFTTKDQWIESIRSRNNEWKNKRVTKVLAEIRSSITQLLDQRVRVEEELNESVDYDEDVLGKLQGSIHQLDDLVDVKNE
ncbi:hypothetical protein ACI2OX_16560 [Bacillus sp. N9]